MSFQTSRLYRDTREFLQLHRERVPYAIGAAAVLIIFLVSHGQDRTVHVYENQVQPDFKDGRILGSSSDSYYDGRDKMLTRSVHDLQSSQKSIAETNEKLQARLDALEKAATKTPEAQAPAAQASPTADGVNPPAQDSRQALLSKEGVRMGPPSEELTPGSVAGQDKAVEAFSLKRSGKKGSALGPSVISFPVKETPSAKTTGIAVPVGSYVKAKLMTGVEAPEGKTYPVLLQLDFAYIIPNKKRVDLSGCFMIAKSQGNLSTERVEMQATKLSCVSKDGHMFEREVNGFIADDKDNSFAVLGSVNSKQDRVAAMAFLSSIVEGVGKAIQQAQTTQQTTPLGGAQSVVTGDSMAYMAGGGAASAASMVTQWYLRQAQNLLPTINVGSGQDVWIVMQDSVQLPNEYFRVNSKGGSNENPYTYFSRVLD